VLDLTFFILTDCDDMIENMPYLYTPLPYLAFFLTMA